MKKVFLFISACLFAFAASATTYDVTVDNADFDLSGDNDVVITSQLNGAVLALDDVINLTIEGYFSADITSMNATIVDNGAAANYWGQLSQWGVDLDFTATAGVQASKTIEIPLSKGAAKDCEKIVIRLTPVSTQVGGVVTLRPTAEADPEGTTYSVVFGSADFGADGAETNYMAEQEFTLDAALLQYDIVKVTFDGSFSQDVSGINFMIFNADGAEILAWTAKALEATAGQAVSTSYEFKIAADQTGEAYKLGVYFAGYDAEKALSFTSTVEPEPEPQPETAINTVESAAFAVEGGMVASAGEIVVYNVAGQVVATASQNFNVNSLAEGVYFITAQEGIIKFVK